MKPFYAALFMFSLLILLSIATTHARLTGADKDSDDKINLTELVNYINEWYRCSACVPDLFQAIEAYYGIVHCTNATGCSAAGNFCDVNMPYTCSSGSDGCLERANGIACTMGQTCRNGACAEIQVPFECNIGENCFYVSVSGTGSHNGSLGNEFNLTEAQNFANTNTNISITFLLASGKYGNFSTTKSREKDAWVTFKGDGDGIKFNSIAIGSWGYNPNASLKFENIEIDPERPLKNLQRAITVYSSNHVSFSDIVVKGYGYNFGNHDAGIYIGTSDSIIIKNCSIYGVGQPPTSAFEYGIEARYSHNVLVEGCEITGVTEGLLSWGYNWTIRNNHIHNVSADGMLIVDTANALIENNYIHDLYVPEGQGFHGDLIQMYNSNPQPHSQTINMTNITIRNNTMYISDGQIALWNGFHEPARNVTFANNLLYGSTTTAAEFHVSETYGLNFENNTVIGTTLFRGNEMSVDINNNIMELYSPYIKEGAVVKSEDNNIIKTYASWGVPSNSSYKLGNHTIVLSEEKFNKIFVNAPKFTDSVLLKRRNYEMTIEEVSIDGKNYSTFSVPGENFEELIVSPRYHLSINGGRDAFTCYTATSNTYSCADMIVWKVNGDTITIIKDITNISGRIVNMSIPYSKSTKTKIYVSDNNKYNLGDIIDYNFQQTPYTIINKGNDSEGKYIEINAPLYENARGQKKIFNWGNNTNVKRDYRPLIDSVACNGSINPPGVAVGALPCV
jgi:hypothetical protein